MSNYTVSDFMLGSGNIRTNTMTFYSLKISEFNEKRRTCNNNKTK